MVCRIRCCGIMLLCLRNDAIALTLLGLWHGGRHTRYLAVVIRVVRRSPYALLAAAVT